MGKNAKNAWEVISIVAGIIVIINPAILAWIVGLYLIVNGILNITNK